MISDGCWWKRRSSRPGEVAGSRHQHWGCVLRNRRPVEQPNVSGCWNAPPIGGQRSLVRRDDQKAVGRSTLQKRRRRLIGGQSHEVGIQMWWCIPAHRQAPWCLANRETRATRWASGSTNGSSSKCRRRNGPSSGRRVFCWGWDTTTKPRRFTRSFGKTTFTKIPRLGCNSWPATSDSSRIRVALAQLSRPIMQEVQPTPSIVQMSGILVVEFVGQMAVGKWHQGMP